MIRAVVVRWWRRHGLSFTGWRAAVRRRLRTALVVLLVAAVTLGLAAIGSRRSHRANKPDLTSGSIWLASRAVGQVTFVDGVSVEVAARVSLGQRGRRFVVAQHGHNAYVAGQDGQLVRIDGATLARTAGSIPPVGNDSVGLFPLRGALYLLDGRRGQVRSADPRNLVPRGQAPAPRRADSVAASDGERLWVLDRRGGGISRFSEWVDATSMRPEIGPAGELHLAVTGGRPVVVNAATDTAYLLSGDEGDVTSRMPVEAGPDDVVSGSADRRGLLLLRPSEGTLRWCDFADASCREPVPVAVPRSDLGAVVEAAGHAFVPDYTSGVVHVVNLATARVADTPRLLDRPVRFELMQRSGIVFFNDPDSEHAGVITADAAVRRVDKYDPRRPTPPDDGADEDLPPPVRNPRPTPSVSSSGRPNPSARPDPSASPDPRTTLTTPSPLPVPTRTIPDAGPPRILRITHTPVAPVTGEQVRFEADITGAPPETWSWSVTPLPDGAEQVVSRERPMQQVFDAAQTYRVALTVNRGGQTDRRTTDVTVIAAPPTVRCGEVIVSNLTLRADLRCAGDGLLIGADDVTIDLNGHKITGSGGGIGIRNDLYSGLDLREGTVTGFATGLQIEAPDETPIQRIRLQDVRITSISAVNAPGLQMIGGALDEGGEADHSNGFALNGVAVSGRLVFDDTRDWSIRNGAIRGNIATIDNSVHGSIVNNELSGATVRLSQTNYLTFTDNLLHNSALIGSASEFFTVLRNTFRDGDIGIDLEATASAGTVIEGNLFERNRIGVRVDRVRGLTLSGNTFRNNGAAGILIDGVLGVDDPTTVAGNTFRSNGNDSGGLRDGAGRPVDDGLHINVPPDTDIVVSGNHAFDNADYGIEAPPGSVRDGGGNTSSGDRNGCLGVACG